MSNAYNADHANLSGVPFPPGLPPTHTMGGQQGHSSPIYQGYPQPARNLDPAIAALFAQVATTNQTLANFVAVPRVEGLRKESDKITVPSIPKATE